MHDWFSILMWLSVPGMVILFLVIILIEKKINEKNNAILETEGIKVKGVICDYTIYSGTDTGVDHFKYTFTTLNGEEVFAIFENPNCERLRLFYPEGSEIDVIYWSQNPWKVSKPIVRYDKPADPIDPF